MMRASIRFGLSFLCLMILKAGIALGDTQTLMISEGNRLEALIAGDVMNRLAIANDRIVNIFGDEGAFVTQTDDQTGQVFIKPTAENGTKPLAITLITENNVTQDLTLTPTLESAATIILKNVHPRLEQSQSEALFSPVHSPEHHGSLPEQWIQIIKKAVLGDLEEEPKKRMTRKAPYDFQLSFDKAYHSGAFIVTVWQVKIGKESQDKVIEQNFYQPGDLALSLKNSQQKIFLYVLRRS